MYLYYYQIDVRTTNESFSKLRNMKLIAADEFVFSYACSFKVLLLSLVTSHATGI